MLFADAHLHTNPIKGLGAKAVARKFKGLGGWFMAIVSLPPHHYGLGATFNDYVKSIEVLINECKTARSEGLVVKCLAGIHPADLERLIAKGILKCDEAYYLALKVLNHISTLIKEGAIDGIGEVGRPHYKTVPEAFVLNNLILRHSLTLARDLNVNIHLHLEQGGYITALDIDELLGYNSVSRSLVMLHHLDIRAAVEAERLGLFYSVPGKLQILREAFKRLKPVYVIESDFVDDPRRPGVSSYPWDIISNQKALVNDDVVNEEYIAKLNIDNIVRHYGVSPP